MSVFRLPALTNQLPVIAFHFAFTFYSYIIIQQWRKQSRVFHPCTPATLSQASISPLIFTTTRSAFQNFILYKMYRNPGENVEECSLKLTVVELIKFYSRISAQALKLDIGSERCCRRGRGVWWTKIASGSLLPSSRIFLYFSFEINAREEPRREFRLLKSSEYLTGKLGTWELKSLVRWKRPKQKVYRKA